MNVRDVVRILDAEVLSGAEKLDAEVQYGGAADMMSDILALCRPGQLVLTGYIQPQVVRTAIVSEVLGLVVVRGKDVPDTTLELARKSGVLILRTALYLFAATGRLYAAGLRGPDER